MKVLLYLDAALAAFGAVMTLAVGFVALVYGLYRDAAPKLHAGLPDLLIITGCFVVLAVLSGLAAWGLWHRRPWHWWFQGLLGLTLPVVYLTVYTHLQSP